MAKRSESPSLSFAQLQCRPGNARNATTPPLYNEIQRGPQSASILHKMLSESLETRRMAVKYTSIQVPPRRAPQGAGGKSSNRTSGNTSLEGTVGSGALGAKGAMDMNRTNRKLEHYLQHLSDGPGDESPEENLSRAGDTDALGNTITREWQEYLQLNAAQRAIREHMNGKKALLGQSRVRHEERKIQAKGEKDIVATLSRDMREFIRACGAYEGGFTSDERMRAEEVVLLAQRAERREQETLSKEKISEGRIEAFLKQTLHLRHAVTSSEGLENELDAAFAKARAKGEGNANQMQLLPAALPVVPHVKGSVVESSIGAPRFRGLHSKLDDTATRSATAAVPMPLLTEEQSWMLQLTLKIFQGVVTSLDWKSTNVALPDPSPTSPHYCAAFTATAGGDGLRRVAPLHAFDPRETTMSAVSAKLWLRRISLMFPHLFGCTCLSQGAAPVEQEPEEEWTVVEWSRTLLGHTIWGSIEGSAACTPWRAEVIQHFLETKANRKQPILSRDEASKAAASLRHRLLGPAQQGCSTAEVNSVRCFVVACLAESLVESSAQFMLSRRWLLWVPVPRWVVPQMYSADHALLNDVPAGLHCSTWRGAMVDVLYRSSFALLAAGCCPCPHCRQGRGGSPLTSTQAALSVGVTSIESAFLSHITSVRSMIEDSLEAVDVEVRVAADDEDFEDDWAERNAAAQDNARAAQEQKWLSRFRQLGGEMRRAFAEGDNDGDGVWTFFEWFKASLHHCIVELERRRYTLLVHGADDGERRGGALVMDPLFGGGSKVSDELRVFFVASMPVIPDEQRTASHRCANSGTAASIERILESLRLVSNFLSTDCNKFGFVVTK